MIPDNFCLNYKQTKKHKQNMTNQREKKHENNLKKKVNVNQEKIKKKYYLPPNPLHLPLTTTYH